MSSTLFGPRPMVKMNIMEHIGELKHRFKIVLIAYAANLIFWLMVPVDITDVNGLMTGMYQPFVSYVMDSAESLAAGRVTIISGSLTSPLEIYFYASALLAFLTASPIMAYEVYKFVDPALHRNERNVIYKFMAAFTGLLAGGALMGYFVLSPATIRFMSYFGVVVNSQAVITAADYYGMIFLIVAATALSFTTPAFFVLFIRFGILSTKTLTNNRLFVYGILYIAIVILTPEPLVAHVGMFLPIVALMEMSVIVGRRVERNRLKAKEAEETAAPIDTGMLASVTQSCSYCGASMTEGANFCQVCTRAQV